MAVESPTVTRTGLDRRLTQRALCLVLNKTTDMADTVLMVPLHYSPGSEQHRSNGSHNCRLTHPAPGTQRPDGRNLLGLPQPHFRQ